MKRNKQNGKTEIGALEYGICGFLRSLDLNLLPAMQAHLGKNKLLPFGAKGFTYTKAPAGKYELHVKINPVGWLKESCIDVNFINDKECGQSPACGRIVIPWQQIRSPLVVGFEVTFQEVNGLNELNKFDLRSSGRRNWANELFDRGFTHTQRLILAQYLRYAGQNWSKTRNKTKHFWAHPILIAAAVGKYQSIEKTRELILHHTAKHGSSMQVFEPVLDLPKEVLIPLWDLPEDADPLRTAELLETYQL